MTTKVTSRPAVPVVKHCAEVKACRLPCGNLAVIYTSSLILPPRDEGLPQGGLRHPAEDQQHRCSLCCLPAGWKHSFCESAAQPMQQQVYRPGSHQLPHVPVGEQNSCQAWQPHSGMHSNRGRCETGRVGGRPLLQLS